MLAVLPLSVFAAILLIGALIASRGKLALSVPMNLLCYLLTGALFAVLARLPGRAGRKQKRRYGR